jgi:hypothetical protein
VLSNVAASASYSAGATATTLSSGTTVSDPESANLVSGTVSISSGTFLTGDTLAAVTTGTSITASYNTSTGVLSLTGSDTLAHYQQVLDSVSYSSSSQNPTNSGADPSRTVSWVVNDGTLNSATQTTTINITGGTPSGADTGTAHGGVASVTGPNPPATARSFDGVAGSYISLASSPFDWNSGPYSVCGRIYVTNNNVLGPGGFNQHFFYDDRAGDGTNYMKVSLRTVVGAGVLTFSRSGHGFYTAVNTIANNTWLDFEFTDSGGSTPTQTLYINGAVVSTTSAPGDLSGDAIASSIGTVTSSAGNLAGRESDLRVYNRVLSASEATQFHLATDPTNGLIHAWVLDDSHVSGTTITDTTNTVAPAGVAGEAINLGLTNPTDHVGPITVNISGVPSGWTMSEGTNNGDGTWTVQTDDIAALSVTSPESYTGALVLDVAENWVNADGGSGKAVVTDNVEVYAKDAPIFALSGDDNLTGSNGDDLFVFSRPIGNDVVYNFNVASDKIDLIDFNNVASFSDIQANLTDDVHGNAVIALGAGGTITLHGVDASSLNANDFVFDQQPVTNNPGNMVVSDGATLPLSGIVNNSGTIVLNSTSNKTNLELIQHGITLQGGGALRLSDGVANAIFGTDPSVTLTNVDNTISGAGQLGEGQLTLQNKGTIIASADNALTIDTGANAVVNSGTLGATGSGGLVIHSDIINSGLLWANGGSVKIDGNVSGTGSALIDGRATFEIGGAFGGNVRLDTGANATLKIDHAADFSGAVAGFDGSDVLDLADLAFGKNTTLGYAANSSNTGGTLTVSDGTHTANIALLGQYMAGSFVMSADGFGGTHIQDSSPATLTQALTHPQHA